MFGTYMGTMSVQASSNNGSTWSSDLWSLSGNQGNSWYRAIVDLSTYSTQTNVMLRWAGTTGSSWSSDMAIDDIVISNHVPESGLWAGINTDWSTGTNWDDGNVPTTAVDVTIPEGYEFCPVINESAVCNDIDVQSGGSLSMTTSGSLYVNGDFNIDGTVNGGNQTISVEGNWNIDGTFNYETSTVVLNNTSKSDNLNTSQHQLKHHSSTNNATNALKENNLLSKMSVKESDNSNLLYIEDNNLTHLRKNRIQDKYSNYQKYARSINLKDNLKGNQSLIGAPSGVPNLTTTFAAGNWWKSNYFDITASGGSNVTINTYDINTHSTGSISVQIWYRTDTYVGHTTDPAGWIQVGTTQTVTGQGTGNPTSVNPGASVTVPNGSEYGFFISCYSGSTGRIRYSNGEYTYSDSYINIECGHGCNTSEPGYGNTSSNPRTWNGTVYYTYTGAPSNDFNFYNLTVSTDGTVTTTDDIHCYNNFTNSSNTVLDMGSNVITVDATYTNNGEIKSVNTATCPASTDTDINGPEGSKDKLTFNPSGDMGSTTVTTHAGVYHSQGTYGLKRWWDINPTTGQTCTIILRMRDEETTNITDWATSEPWVWNGSTWTQNGTYSTHNTSGGFTTVTYTNFSITGGKASNVITLSQNDPLPVGLISFTVNTNKNDVTLNWKTAWEINNAGFDIERQSLAIKKDIWKEIGFVEGFGTTNEPTNYSFQDKKLQSGKYNYRLIQRDYNNRSYEHFLSDIVTVGVPKKYALSQNYPNPFNPTTKIDYDLPYAGKVNVVLFDITGRQVETLVNEVHEAGYYTVEFNASYLASGVYFYRIIAKGGKSDFIMTKKMVLIK